MSLVENLINQISNNGLGGITKPQGFDLSDDTFAKLLEKQLNSNSEPQAINQLGQIGAPAGLIIEPFDAIEFSSTAQDQMEILGENKLTNESQPIEPIEIKDIDVGDYFSSLLKSSSKDSDFMNFAKKNAHNAYDAFSRNYIFDIEDFVEDLSSKM